MTWILVIYTSIPAWFVGPIAPTQLSPGSPPIYHSGPALALPQPANPDGIDRLIIVVDPPCPQVSCSRYQQMAL